jgi:hypothetical protein
MQLVNSGHHWVGQPFSQHGGSQTEVETSKRIQRIEGLIQAIITYLVLVEREPANIFFPIPVPKLGIPHRAVHAVQ